MKRLIWEHHRNKPPRHHQSFLRSTYDRLMATKAYDETYGALNYCHLIREAVLDIITDRQLLDQIDLTIGDIEEVTNLINYGEIDNYMVTHNIDGQTETMSDRAKVLHLLLISYLSLKYIEWYLPTVGIHSKSLKAILTLCFSPQMVLNLDYSDPTLDVLSGIFNNMVGSYRKNLQCYDCGTTARGVFYNLIKANRKGGFSLSSNEIDQFKTNYYYDAPDRFTSFRNLINDLKTVPRSGVFIAGVRFGDDMFGHVFIFEVIVDPDDGNSSNSNSSNHHCRRIIRLYQSALGSYLLIDYVYRMGYLEQEEIGIDLDEYEKDTLATMEVNSWSHREDALFAKWYAFWPQGEIKDTEPMRYHHAYILY